MDHSPKTTPERNINSEGEEPVAEALDTSAAVPSTGGKSLELQLAFEEIETNTDGHHPSTSIIEELSLAIGIPATDGPLGPGAHAIDVSGFDTEDPPNPPNEDTAILSQGNGEADGSPNFRVTADGFLVSEDTPQEVSEEEEEEEVIQGIVLKNNTRRPNKIPTSVLLGVFLAVLVLLLVLLFSLRGQDETADAINQSPAANTSAVVDHFSVPFSDDLPVSVLQEIEKGGDSPFYQANVWVLEDPNLKLYSLKRLKQRFYLAMLFFSTNGKGWTQQAHWLSYNVSECKWFSSSSHPKESVYFEPNVCDTDSTVINLSLANNNLTGSLPIWYTPFVPILRILDLGHNSIGGHLPALTTTPYLEVLVLSSNLFTGSPTLNAGPYYPNLRVFKGDFLQFNGAYGGAFLRILPKMEVYNATGMQMNGEAQLYTTLGMMTHLKYFGLGHTNVVSTIPSEIGSCTDLETLDVSSLPNAFGTIPSELGLLTQLTLFDLEDSPHVIGKIPPGLCHRAQNGLLSIKANCSVLECC